MIVLRKKMDEPTAPITLTGLEVVFLTDAIKNDDAPEGRVGQGKNDPIGRDTLLLLGSAYEELVTADGVAPGPVVLYISQEIAWLFRSKVKTGDLGIDGKTKVGVSLLPKIYKLLLEFNSDLSLDTVDADELTDDVKMRLEEYNARAHQDTNRDSDTDYGTGAVQAG